jgi:hypothetical protein
MKKLSIFAVAGAIALSATAGFALTEFPIFVGKGEVQEALDWNNRQLQTQAGDLEFALVSVTETTWTCQKDGATNSQERSRETTTAGVVSHSERERNQITGFWLIGFSGETSVETGGPALGSCPTGWSEVVGSRETTDEGSSIRVRYDGGDWFEL